MLKSMFEIIKLLLISIALIADLCQSKDVCHHSTTYTRHHGVMLEDSLDLRYCELDTLADVIITDSISYINANHNNFHSLPRIERARQIHHLSMSYNKITRIEKFYPEYEELLTLDLSHNSISTVEKGSLSDLKELLKIDLSFNNLTHLDQDTFHLQMMREIYLNDNRLLTLNLLLYSNNLVKIDVTNNGLNAVQLIDPSEIDEDSGWYYTIDLKIHLGNNVTVFNYQLMNRFDADIFVGHNLVSINVTSKVIANELNLARNRLRTSANCTLKSDQLENLYLQDNQLETIETHWLDGMRNIRVLNLTNNRLTVIDGQFKRLIALETLLLTANRIESIEDRDHLTKSENLREIDLSENQLTAIETPLNYHSNLTKLNLSHNKLSKFNTDSLNGAKLKFLDVSHNRLQSIDLPSAILSDLIEFDASDNGIKRLDAEQFRNVQNLERIALSDNLIDDLPVDLFVDQVNLQTIDFSHNRLTKFVLQLPNTTTSIDLSHNSLHRLESKTFNFLHQLNHLNLSDNELDDLPIDLFVNKNKLHVLDLSRNNFSAIPLGLLRSHSNLSTLNLAHNKLKNVKGYVFKGLHNLITLNLDFNEFKNFNVTEIKDHLPSLRWIALDGNTWSCEFLDATLRNLQEKSVFVTGGRETDDENIHGIACDNNNDYNRENDDNKQINSITTTSKTEDEKLRLDSFNINTANDKFAIVMNKSNREWNDCKDDSNAITQKFSISLIVINLIFLSIIIVLLHFAKNGLLFNGKKHRCNDCNEMTSQILQEDHNSIHNC